MNVREIYCTMSILLTVGYGVRSRGEVQVGRGMTLKDVDLIGVLVIVVVVVVVVGTGVVILLLLWWLVIILLLRGS